MDEHADGCIGYGEPGRAEQSRLDTHHIGGDKQGWPSHSGGDERQPPPTSEYKAEQDQYRDHGEPFSAAPNMLSSATCFIALGPRPGQASVQASGLSLSFRLPTLVVWLSFGLRSPGRRPKGGESGSPGDGPGRTPGNDYKPQRDQLSSPCRLFGEVTSRTRQDPA